MNYNILAYIVYIIVIVIIIGWLGRRLHSIGRIFILNLYKDDLSACDAINNILLVAYYLFNIGYALLKLRRWQYVRSCGDLVYSLSLNIGLLLIILAVTHYFNMAMIYLASKKRKDILNHKNQIL